MAAQHDVPSSAIKPYLTIIQGDAKVPISVAAALISPTDRKVLVGVILSGIGSYPSFQRSVRTPLTLKRSNDL
jgi:hypothetical protein